MQSGTPVTGTTAPLPRLSGRVLLAEDGEDNQRLLMAFLKQAGLHVTLAVNGAEAVRSAEACNFDFDLVLMDMQMPVMDGYLATRVLRRAGYARPIIAVTANAAAEDRAKCLAAGCSEYLSKPISRQTLLATCASQMASSPVASAVIPPPRASQIVPCAGAPTAPLCSSLAHDSRVAKVLDRFVSRLPERVSQIRQCLDAGDLEQLRQAVHNLKGAGSGYGFAPLSEQSARTEDALRAEQSLECVRREVEHLLQLIRRVQGYNAAAEAPAGTGPAPVDTAG